MSKWIDTAELALEAFSQHTEIPYDFERFDCEKELLPDTYVVYFLVSQPPVLYADNKEVSSQPRIQVSLYFRNKSVMRSVPDELIKEFTSKGFCRVSAGRIPYQQNTGHYGWHCDFVFYETR